ncbi:transcription and mRNA export factor Sus1p [Diutina catenulata]
MTSELDQVKSQIQSHLVSSGNYDAINKQLKVSLYKSGWFDEVSDLAKAELTQKQDANFNELYQSVKPKAEDLVPEQVKKEIMDRIRQYVEDIVQ